MNDPNAVANPTNTNWMGDDVPAGDMSLDDLFAEPTAPQQTTANQPQSQPAPQAQPVQDTSFEIKAGKSVYKSVEDAQRGIIAKDELIDNLRNQWILTHGYDPVTKKPVSQTPEGPTSYLQDNKRYMRDLKDAVEKGDEMGYFNAQSKLIFDLLQPLAPTINEMARRQAADSVSSEVKDFNTFRQSEDFRKVLDGNGLLKDAIEQAENDFRGHAQLPQLYKLAYLAAQGSKVPELVKQATQAAQVTAPQTQNPRPTIGSSTLAPPIQNGNTARPTLATSEGRKALIKDFLEQGGENLRF